MIFAVKHDSCHKATFVTGGHLTQPAIESVYSGVVPIHSICIILLIAKINDLETFQADLGNAYLEAYTKEEILFIARKEFTTFRMEGHILIISKVLYGLHTSGKWFHEVLSDTLHMEGFSLCKVDSDVWMQHNGDTHEYVAVYVDDLLCVMKDQRSFLDHLMQVQSYKLKCDEPFLFHLGCDFGDDPGGTCYYQPKVYK